MSQMHNPFAEERDRTVFQIGKGVSVLFSLAFLTMLALPALVYHVAYALTGKWEKTPAAKLLSWRPSQGKLQTHIHGVEKNLDKDAPYSVAMRQYAQSLLYTQAGEGNRMTFIGFDGWLFFQPDLNAITGYGPLKREAFSVMKDPEKAKLSEPREIITGFAAQLKERGISLLLVPVPLKPMLYSEDVSTEANFAWVTHPDAAAYYEVLRQGGVDVLDLTAELSKLRSKRQHIFVRAPDRKDKEAIEQAEKDAAKLQEAFLMQDTHWTPEAMRFCAEKVAQHVKAKYPVAPVKSEQPIRAYDGIHRSSMGDLVKLLDLKNPEAFFTPETAFLRVIGEGTESKTSPVVLLGDSFVNIYDDPTLGFANPQEPNPKDPKERIRAGFAQHLSLLLESPLDVIAMNGRGSTGVRQEFAMRYDDEVRAKKLVIWVIAARDLLLSKTAARDANITWAPVTFNTKLSSSYVAPSATGGPVVVEATLTEKSANQDVNGTPYTNALHAAVYDITGVTSGTLADKQIIGVQWTFKEKQMQPTASFAVGKRYRLTIVPWDKQKTLEPSMGTMNLQDDTTAFDAQRWYVEKAEEIK